MCDCQDEHMGYKCGSTGCHCHDESKKDEPEYPNIWMIEWEDTTNIQEWTNLADIAEFAQDCGYICRNVGYLIHEDNNCVVIAARISMAAKPTQVGLYERIPKSIIRQRWRLHEMTKCL